MKRNEEDEEGEDEKATYISQTSSNRDVERDNTNDASNRITTDSGGHGTDNSRRSKLSSERDRHLETTGTANRALRDSERDPGARVETGGEKGINEGMRAVHASWTKGVT